MCFSATASFTAGAGLLLVGAATARQVRRRPELPFALIPLLFAVQQLIEGALWLTFPDKAPWLNTALTYAYSLFSHVLWPIYVPLAVLLIEPPGWRRKALIAFSVAGIAVGTWLLYAMARYGIVSRPTGRHVEYVSPHFFAAVAMTLYLLSTGVSLLFSAHRLVKVFGLLALLSFAAAYAFYALWFISVWCFFAAVLSGVVYLHLRNPRVGLHQRVPDTRSHGARARSASQLH
ncbi:DUF6629 family protein [Roseateles saccharophilus]|uniref:Uncharacterized protein n=1 Tax=Roseateles saccharophilus TaxID=304 RepID=A0A4V2VQH6_ROSSA|nr:DUF6629 family protein [Roseateles saccharophilus]TCU94639.1 hypothetical protein EV671_101661 [Roseateles saccharophilus]